MLQLIRHHPKINALLTDARSRCAAQLREFWLEKQPMLQPQHMKIMADAFADGASDREWPSSALHLSRLEAFLISYLDARELPRDAEPDLTLQHRMLFAEYFSPRACFSVCTDAGHGC